MIIPAYAYGWGPIPEVMKLYQSDAKTEPKVESPKEVEPIPVKPPAASAPAATKEEYSEIEMRERHLIKMGRFYTSCDWCMGGACDLVYPREEVPFTVWADVDNDDGMLTVHVDDTIVAARKVNYCPMCGGKLGEDVYKLFRKVVQDT